MRGRQSRYLPGLLSHAQFVLGLDSLTSHMSLLFPSYDDTQQTEQLITEFEADAQAEEGNQHDNALAWKEQGTEKLGSLLVEQNRETSSNNWDWLDEEVYAISLVGI